MEGPSIIRLSLCVHYKPYGGPLQCWRYNLNEDATIALIKEKPFITGPTGLWKFIKVQELQFVVECVYSWPGSFLIPAITQHNTNWYWTFKDARLVPVGSSLTSFHKMRRLQKLPQLQTGITAVLIQCGQELFSLYTGSSSNNCI